jgi:putative endonuclease
MTMERQVLGKTGETLAAEELERRGYAILDQRYRTRHGEIDIIARDGETIVFVEVKVRQTSDKGTAAEAVAPAKQRRLVSMAVDYLARHGLHESPCRFDVVAIDGTGDGQRLVVYPHAFIR